MNRFRKQGRDGEYNFWQPATDLMTGLVFILMLLVALLGLYLLYTPSLFDAMEPSTEALAEEQGDIPETGGYGELEGDGADEEEGDGYGDGEDNEEGDDDGNGDGDGDGDDDGGDGYGPGDEGVKSAVLAELIDGETRRIVKAENVKFELHESNGSLQILHTYYPEKISYRTFETTKEGIFYLPEKIWKGTYYFRGLTAPDGYDPADNQYFEIGELYDWPAPFLVQIPVFPSKNVIRIQMTDAESGMGIGDGVFEVIAAEDIRTLDGTVRFGRGQTVERITCDSSGYGESGELYLGNYILRQDRIPPYYAGIEEEAQAVVERKTDTEPGLCEIGTVKTRIRVCLSDELFPEQTVEGAGFLVTKEGDPTFQETMYTDSQGVFELTDLDKNAVYHIVQKTAPGNYRADETDHRITVEDDGRIDGQPQTTLELSNRMLRVAIGAVDAVLGSGIPDVALDLYDSGDHLLFSWETSGNELLFTDLKEGFYYVVKNRDPEKRYDLQVTDSKELQTLHIPVITWMSAAAVAGAAAGLALLILLIVFLVKTAAKCRRKDAAALKQSEQGDRE